MVEHLNIAIPRDVSYSKDTLTSFRSTEHSNECESLLIAALENPLSILERQLSEKKSITDTLLVRSNNRPCN